MEGFLQSVSPRDRKKQWQPLYVKLDDISATLVAFKDRAQVDVRWKMSIANADVASPVPGEPNHGINVDDTAYCFYVRNTTATSDDWHYFAAADDSNKKEWMKKLMQVARDGPHEARFASDRAESEYAFTARVDKFRVHDKGHAEYSIVCHCEIFSKLVARRMSKEWTVWHRFSEFEALDETLRKALGPEMKDIVFIKHTRDAFRTIFRTALDHTFLEQRRLQLDTYLKKVCENRRTVDFFKHHSNADLKAFFCFDENCENVDQSPRKNTTSRRKKSPSDSDSRSRSSTGQTDITDRSSSVSSASEADRSSPRATEPQDDQVSSDRRHHHHHHRHGEEKERSRKKSSQSEPGK